MIGDFTVIVDYKTKDKDMIERRTYPFEDYSSDIGARLKRVLGDIESLSDISGEAEKTIAFNKIRHVILDCANAIERLPNNMCYKNIPCRSMDADKYLADIFENFKPK